MGSSVSIRLILDSRVSQRLLQSVVVGVISLNNGSLVSMSSRMARVVKGVCHISMGGRVVMSALLGFSDVVVDGRRIGRLAVLRLVGLDRHLVLVVGRGAVLASC